MRVLDLFSGIGGFSLGLERAGLRTVAFCESDPYCRAVLRRHWPDVPIHDDVRTLHGATVGPVDLIAGGFPCTDISIAGKGAGLAGERSGLWTEFARVVREVRPRYVIVENVAALLGRGMGTVLGDLAALGYDAEWHCIPAAVIGAPHRRDRVWIIARPNGGRREGERIAQHENEQSACRRESDGLGAGRRGGGPSAADATRVGVERDGSDRQPESFAPALAQLLGRDDAGDFWREWTTEPPICRVADGGPGWAHRIRSLGNAVVPQIVEVIGRAIMRIEHGELA